MAILKVEGKGRASKMPTMMEVVLTVHAVTKNPNDSVGKLAVNVRTVRSSLKELMGDDGKTSSIFTRSLMGENKRIKGYESSQTVTVCVSLNLDVLVDVIDYITAQYADIVVSQKYNFVLRKDERIALVKEAKKNAFNDAQEKALFYASLMEKKSVNLIEIVEVSSSYDGYASERGFVGASRTIGMSGDELASLKANLSISEINETASAVYTFEL